MIFLVLIVDITINAKSLVILMDCSLQMKDHVNNTVSAASFFSYNFGQISKYLDR